MEDDKRRLGSVRREQKLAALIELGVRAQCASALLCDYKVNNQQQHTINTRATVKLDRLEQLQIIEAPQLELASTLANRHRDLDNARRRRKQLAPEQIVRKPIDMLAMSSTWSGGT